MLNIFYGFLSSQPNEKSIYGLGTLIEEVLNNYDKYFIKCFSLLSRLDYPIVFRYQLKMASSHRP